MAQSFNQITLIGNLGNDAETKFLDNGLAITSFSLATTHSYKDKAGQWVNNSTWHRITLFNAPDYVKEQLKKGKKVFVVGRQENKEYEKDGIKKYTSTVIAERIVPCFDIPKNEENNGTIDEPPF